MVPFYQLIIIERAFESMVMVYLSKGEIYQCQNSGILAFKWYSSSEKHCKKIKLCWKSMVNPSPEKNINFLCISTSVWMHTPNAGWYLHFQCSIFARFWSKNQLKQGIILDYAQTLVDTKMQVFHPRKIGKTIFQIVLMDLKDFYQKRLFPIFLGF